MGTCPRREHGPEIIHSSSFILHPSEHGPEVGAAILEEATTAVLSTVDLPTVLERTARLLRRHFGETRVVVLRRLEGSPARAEVVLSDDPRHPAPAPGTRVELIGTASGEALNSGRTVVADPVDAAHPRFRDEEALSQLGYGSLVSMPLLFEGQALGTLELAHPPGENLLSCCLRTAEQVARLVAIAMHNGLLVEEIRRLNRLLDRENALLREELREVRRESRYVVESPRMKDLVARLRLVAPTDATVLVRGETGTGKEGLARMVHEFSGRFGGPYVVVNMGAISESLIESELFGHEKGAFTGASARKAGRFEQADGGTVFLDEVGDAPAAVQVRLLRVLQEREVQRVGGGDTFKVDVRVVAATNRPLERMVEQGSFRADLYYRLAAFPLQIPSLRERPEDIRAIGTHLLERLSATMHRRPPAVDDAMWRVLESMPWPGNVRELENYLQRALLLSPETRLVLPEAVPAPAAPECKAEAQPGSTPRRFDDEVRDILRRALETCGGRVYGPGGAARLLGLQPTTLQGKLRKYGLERAARAAGARG